MSATLRVGRWTVDVQQEWIDVTSSFPSPDPRWTYTDQAGHEHHYSNGYPTLRYVVDGSHWCDGTEGLYNHDPHLAVDEYHYECQQCGEVIEPRLVPGGYPQSIPGMISATLSGIRRDGIECTYYPMGQDAHEALIAAIQQTDTAVDELLNTRPEWFTLTAWSMRR